jgi:hypothetical protein
MKTTVSKKTKSVSTYNMIPWTASEVVKLPTVRGVHIPTLTLVPSSPVSKIIETKVRKPPVQAKVPVKVGDKSYQSICAMMKGEGIQDRAKEGLDNNWSKIRNSLKKTGGCTWKFSDKREITITQG